MLAWACVAALALAATLAHTQLSDTDQHIVAAARNRTPATLELPAQVVRINSGTMNPEGARGG